MTVEKDDAYYREEELKLKKRELDFKERENTFGARFVKSVAIMLPLLISLAVTLISYQNQQSEREDAAATAERKAALDVQKVSLYAEAVFVTGKIRRIAATPEGRASKEFNRLEGDFENLYWSRLPLVENEKVENAMVAFRDGLAALKKPPSGGSESQEISQAKLDSRALDLARAMRQDLESQPAAAAVTPAPHPSP